MQEIAALATLPGKEELFSKLLFLIQSPAQRLATVVNATGRDLAVVINQAVEKGKFAAGAAQVPRLRPSASSLQTAETLLLTGIARMPKKPDPEEAMLPTGTS